jgi:hypothetical protein
MPLRPFCYMQAAAELRVRREPFAVAAVCVRGVRGVLPPDGAAGLQQRVVREADPRRVPGAQDPPARDTRKLKGAQEPCTHTAVHVPDQCRWDLYRASVAY